MKAFTADEAPLIRAGLLKSCAGSLFAIRPAREVIFFIFALLLLGGGSVGCGKKGDPLPPLHAMVPIIKDIGAENRADGVLLIWSIPQAFARNRKTQFRVLRAEGATSCGECPEDWRLVAEILMYAQESGQIPGGRMEFLDRDVSEGAVYRYRVMIKTEQGDIGPPSGTVQIRRQNGGVSSNATERKSIIP